MAKILLINPPFYRLMGSHYNGLQLGLCYITAVLKNQGHQVMIYNADFEERNNYLDQRGLFENYGTYKKLLYDLNSSIWKEVEEKIRDYDPDIAGISMHTGTYKSVINVAEIVKLVSRKIKVVVGGTHPTLDPEGTLRNDAIDFVVRGEGEYSFLEFADGRDYKKILGLSYKNDKGIIVHNPPRSFIANLDELPFPDRESLFDAPKHDRFSIITGRGCPYECTYCASPKKWDRKVRFRSIENIIKELRELKEYHHSPMPRVYFVDDTFTLVGERVKEICRQMINENLNLKWKCESRADILDEELISLMKDAGCIRVKIGVESGSDRILRMIKKGVTKEQMRKSIKLFKDRGISLTLYLMAGFPSETREELEETIKFAEELDASYYSLSIFAPYYGTEIYKELKKSGMKFNRDHWEYFFHQSEDMIINDHLDKEIVDRFLALNERPNKGVRI